MLTKTTILAIFLVIPIAVLAAHDQYTGCKTVGTQCVSVVMKADGSFWLADRVYKNERYSWVPIKPTECPNSRDRRFSVYTSIDRVYGAYRCVYPAYGDGLDATPTIGSNSRSITHYVRTHKLLLITDTVLVLSSLADSASSVTCEQTSHFCGEDNPLLPRHPSPAQLYAFKMGVTGGIIVWNHYFVARKAGKWNLPKWYYESWSAGVIAGSIKATKSNVDLTERLSAAQTAERLRLRADLPLN
jgi:hypothetical protein